MKKVYSIWSHELIEKLDFYGFFYCHGDFFHVFHEILILGSSSKTIILHICDYFEGYHDHL